MIIKDTKIVVIGGAGFIGSHVVESLLRTQVREVVVFDNFVRGRLQNLESALRDPRCSVFEAGGDIRDVEILNAALEGADGVFHLAAMWLLHCREYPRTAFDVNVQGTFNVLEACVRNCVKRLVYSSSASVYGDAISVPMTEAHPFNNRNFYGATKIAGEAIVSGFYERFGLNYVGLRYMNVYGPRQNHDAAYTGVIPAMLNKIDSGEVPIINGDGGQAYDFVTVGDVARSNVLAMESDLADTFYNVGTGVQTSIKDLSDLVLELTSAKVKVKFKPYSLDDSRQLVNNRIGSTEKAETEIGFKYHDDLQKGLQELIAWRTKN